MRHDLLFEILASTTGPAQSAPQDLKARIVEALGVRQEDPMLAALAANPEITPAPSRLKSRIYSNLIKKQQESGALLSLSKTLSPCVFEHLVSIAPVGQTLKQYNCCSVCHARLVGERVENAWIFWGNCPYVRFQNR